MTRCEQSTPGHSTESAMHTDLEAKITNEIQAKLLANQEEFWRRGQVEIKRMQQQQKEVADALIKMQEQQSELAVEHQRMKGALVEVTAKFEQVVKQMREVIWALPPQMWQQAQQGKSSGSPHGAEEVALCTPPRTSAQDAPGIAAASSPAVLSLASALPSSVSPGFKMLNLAEWIPDQASTGKSTQTPSLPTRSKRMSLSSGADEHTFQVEIVKEMGFTTLGIEVNEEHGALRVEHIDEHGLVGKFNLQESTRKIMEGDCIVEVNGVEQDPDKMVHEIKAAKVVGLVLVRPQADSPLSLLTKLRPEAQAFVPFEQGDRALRGGSPSRDPGAAAHSGSSDSMKVNRTLFVDELVGNNSG